MVGGWIWISSLFNHWRAQPEENVDFENLGSWLESKLLSKYQRGLCRVSRAIVSLLSTLAILERLVLNLGGLICYSLNVDAKEPASVSAMEHCKFIVDRIIQSMEFAGDFAVCADYNTFLRMIRLCKDLNDNMTDGLKTMQESRICKLIPQSSIAFEYAAHLLPQYSSNVIHLEDVVEESKLLTQHIGDVKHRILKRLPPVSADIASVREGQTAWNDYVAAKSKYEDLLSRTRALCLDEDLQEGRRLAAEREDLVASMNAILAPFVRISHNIQGKGITSLGGNDLTPDEISCVQKYTTVLIKKDPYEYLEYEGTIENLLEALFLLGIAGGVGMDETAARHSGLSRRSQALLTDALNNFDADRLRTSYTEWRMRARRAAELEAGPEYRARRDAARSAAAELLEAAAAVDRARLAVRQAEDTRARVARSVSEFRDHVVTRC